MTSQQETCASASSVPQAASTALTVPSLDLDPAYEKAPAKVVRLFSNASGPRDLNDFAGDCLYEDLLYQFPSMLPEQAAYAGRHRRQPPGFRFVIDRVSDGIQACGIVWHVEQTAGQGKDTLSRGLTFARLDADGRLCYVREITEPVSKNGLTLEQIEEMQLLLGAPEKASIQARAPASTSHPEVDTPRTSRDVVRFLFGEKPSGSGRYVPGNLSNLFSDDIIYEDMNYQEPFVGRAALEKFLGTFRGMNGIASGTFSNGVTFEVEDVTDGVKASCFTYLIRLPDKQPPIKPIKGVMFLEVNSEGKVCYVRDIPLVSERPPPLILATKRMDGGGLMRFKEGGDTRLGGKGRLLNLV